MQKKTIKQNNKWKKDYKKQGYKFMSRENIYKSVAKILNIKRTYNKKTSNRKKLKNK